MTDDFGFSSEDDGPPDETINFFAELERLATEENFIPFQIILMSGDQLRVDSYGQLTIYQTMYIHHTRSEDVMFPFPSVCAVRLLKEES